MRGHRPMVVDSWSHPVASGLYPCMLSTMRLSLLTAVASIIGACGGDAVRHIGDAPPSFDATADAADRDAAATGCVPTTPATEVCDHVDNDCDGLVDNVDVGMDGIYDCQQVLILGNPGLNGTSNFTAWLNGNGTTVTRLTDPTVTVDATLLASYDLVVLDRLGRLYSSDEATALTTWVAGGGGVMALSGYTGAATDYTYPNSLISGMGAQIGGALTSATVTSFATHPLTQGLTSITYSGGFTIIVDAPATTPVTVIAQIGTTPIASAADYGAGRVYLWADEWVTFDSVWQGNLELPQFWSDAFGWLGRFR